MRSTRMQLIWPALLVVLALTTAGTVQAADTPAQSLDHASTLYQNSRLVEAKRTLIRIDRSALTSEEGERLFSLMTVVDRRLRRADPISISLEKATLALNEGDLREADRQAHAARRADSSSPEQSREAQQILDQSAQLKLELTPMVESTLAQAMTDFEARRYAQAKAGVDSVYRSGVELSRSQLRLIDRYRSRITRIEQDRGEPFASDYIPMAVLKAEGAAEQSQPEPATETETDPQPEPATEPEPSAESKPTEDDQAKTQQEQDLFQQALKFDAQRRLAEADNAFDAGRYTVALENYLLITGQYREHSSPDDVQRSEARIAEIRALLQQQGGNMIQQELNRSQLVRERAIAEFDNLLAEARKSLGAGDTEKARQLASEARLRISEARAVFSQAEYDSRISAQQSLVGQIISSEEQIRKQETTQRSERLQSEARQQESQREKDKYRKIRESLGRIRALQIEQKYEEALQVVDQVLFLDPNNPAALLLKDTMQDLMIYRDWALTQRNKTLGFAREKINIQKSLIIPDQLLAYPPDWPEISFRRGEPIAFQESPADRKVLAELRNRKVPGSFTDARLEDVVEFFAQVTNLNVDVDWESLGDIGVTRDDLVSLNLQPMQARVLLDRILRKVSPDSFSRANWAVEDGVLVIASDEALRRNTTVQIYDVRDLLFQIEDFDEVPNLGLGRIQQGQGGGSTTTFTVEDSEQPTEEELLDKIIEIIQNNIDPNGWRENGGDTGDITDLNRNLIITNTARNHQKIAALLSQLREVRSIQVAVETRFLLVDQNFFEQIGFDIDLIFNAQNSQYRNALTNQANFATRPADGSTGTSTLLPSDLVGPFFGGSRTGASNEIVNTNFADIAQATGNPPVPEFAVQAVPFVTSRPSTFSQLPVQGGSNTLAEDLLNGSQFAVTTLATSPALALAGTFLDDIQVDFLLEATQADRRSITLTAPRLTFTNGSSATLSVLTEEAFVSNLTIISGTGGIGFQPQIGRVGSGFTLVIDGVVSADRRYVTLQIQAQLAKNIRFVEFVGASQAVAAGAGANAVGGGGIVEGNIQQPVLQTTIIRTGVTVPDQGTVLMGGQRVSSEIEIESGVPVLSKIPVINRFFTNRIEDKQDSTLLILVKPTILIQSEEEEKNFPGLMDSLQNRFGSGF